MCALPRHTWPSVFFLLTSEEINNPLHGLQWKHKWSGVNTVNKRRQTVIWKTHKNWGHTVCSTGDTLFGFHFHTDELEGNIGEASCSTQDTKSGDIHSVFYCGHTENWGQRADKLRHMVIQWELETLGTHSQYVLQRTLEVSRPVNWWAIYETHHGVTHTNWGHTVCSTGDKERTGDNTCWQFQTHSDTTGTHETLGTHSQYVLQRTLKVSRPVNWWAIHETHHGVTQTGDTQCVLLGTHRELGTTQLTNWDAVLCNILKRSLQWLLWLRVIQVMQHQYSAS